MLSDEWGALDTELAAISDESAVAVTRVVLQALRHATRLPADALDNNLGTFHSDLTGIRQMVQLAGDPTIGRRRKPPGTASS